MEINLMNEYPERKRNLMERVATKTKEQIETAKKFGWEYFDAKDICYGGYIYDGRWTPVVKRFIDYYGLKSDDKILDCGCAKGYMLYDFLKTMPSLRVTGIDISEYAIECCPLEVKPFLKVGNVIDLSMFKDKEFNFVVCITTIHNLKEIECRQAIREIQRVGKNAFIKVDAYRTEEDRERMLAWNITAETILSVDEWIKLFKEERYTGDYYWFMP